MKFKIKVLPEDFVVEEIADLPLSKSGPYSVYLAQKRGINTIDLLFTLSRQLGLPLGSLSFGGRKDKHALTSQYISLQSGRVKDLKENNYSIKFVGYMNRPMGPDLIKKNSFKVTLRSLDSCDVDKVNSEISQVNTYGFANYFDDQRFGSYDPRLGFFAEKILKKQFSGALKSYFSSMYSRDSARDKAKKEIFFKKWKEWSSCLEVSTKEFERKAFTSLLKSPGAYLEVLKKIGRYELSLFYSAYQSFVWNEVLRRLIISIESSTKKSYSGVAGEYIFYESLDSGNLSYFMDLMIHLPGRGFVFPQGAIGQLYQEVFKNEGLEKKMFNSRKLNKAYFKPFLRSAVIKPQGLSIIVCNDEIYGKKKIKLNFSLCRGGFATMFIKRIFAIAKRQ